ncbi:TPA: hypothetical protein DEO28_01745 [Candidatus Dependentiae bacterium]|nr:MAG: hypothetical protein UR14_C0004G0039 [candidate division TM6 bacterium GW2011_GWE2_31_21]KKP52957.1 MAG: hypothetical protein UR43_C0008G0039 [candidate division TM6 bacterium GW2011_GWF2_33_332]HBS47805.1 hypothetical protein [Candidatus Dependentiae bacterium]HBZ73219.1 hypothetical protein [Candidatus Dependentiae bacterium]
MEILKDSIKDFSSTFKDFEEELTGCNFVVSFDLIKFEFVSPSNFVIQDLEALFKDSKIEGLIEESNFDEFEKNVFKSFSYIPYNLLKERFFQQIIIAKKRESKFWELIMPFFERKPKKILKHIATGDSCLNFYVMWGFCYIFIFDDYGIVIAGQAWD